MTDFAAAHNLSDAPETAPSAARADSRDFHSAGDRLLELIGGDQF